jgi:hypothetical protein
VDSRINCAPLDFDAARDLPVRFAEFLCILHKDALTVVDASGQPIEHTKEWVSELFDEELHRIIRELPQETDEAAVEKYVLARRLSEQMIERGEFDPV